MIDLLFPKNKNRYIRSLRTSFLQNPIENAYHLNKQWWKYPQSDYDLIHDVEPKYHKRYLLFVPLIYFRDKYSRHRETFWFLATIISGILGDIFFR